MIATVNGIKMAYSDEGQGLPLVFVHGFPLSRSAWQGQIDGLKASYRVIAPDLRGLGESESRSDTSMAQYAQDIHALLTQLGTGPVVLIGHSMGGYVVFEFARQFSGMLRGLVLVGTKSGADTAEAAAGRRATAEKVAKEGPIVVVDAMAAKMLSAKNSDPTMATRVRAFMSPSRPDGVIAALHAMAQRSDSTDSLAKIRVATLVITGGDDTIIPPSESEKLAAGIQGAQLTVIPDAGHLVGFEKPTEFNQALREWLRATFVT